MCCGALTLLCSSFTTCCTQSSTCNSPAASVSSGASGASYIWSIPVKPGTQRQQQCSLHWCDRCALLYKNVDETWLERSVLTWMISTHTSYTVDSHYTGHSHLRSDYNICHIWSLNLQYNTLITYSGTSLQDHLGIKAIRKDKTTRVGPNRAYAYKRTSELWAPQN